MSLEIILGIVMAAVVLVSVGVVVLMTQSEKNEIPAVRVNTVVPQPLASPAQTVLGASAPGGDSFYAEQLQAQVKDLQEKLQEAQQDLASQESLRADNQSLKKELQEITERYRDILSQFDAYKTTADAQTAALIKEKEIAQHQAQDSLSGKSQELIQEITDLKRTQEKLKEMNNTLSVKTDMLQYELVKSRAQATGFERISQNYRQQLEQLHEVVKGVNKDNTQLSQHKNRLEEMLTRIQREHEDLSRREKLAQFEIVKKHEAV